jgi:hypothetical protein
MGDPIRIAAIRDHSSEPLGDAEPTIGLGEQHDPAIGTDPPAVKGGGDLLAADGWKAERQKVIVGHGGRGVPRSRQRVGFSNRILRQIKSLRYFRHPKSAPVMNTTGFRNGPLGVKPPSDDLATVIVLPFVVDTRVATSCHQMGAGEPI